MKRYQLYRGQWPIITDPNGEYILYKDHINAMANMNTSGEWQKIKKKILIILGKCRCSGYGVYPDGIRCPGCSDCDKNCSDGMCGVCNNCKIN